MGQRIHEDATNPAAVFGHEVGLTDRAFARFAIMMCEGAADGSITADDTAKMLEDFNEARRKARGDARRSEPPSKVQASKLRSVIKAGEMFGHRAVKLLELTAKLHVRELSAAIYEGKLRYSGEYNALVEVARFAVAHNHIPTQKEIIELLTFE